MEEDRVRERAIKTHPLAPQSFYAFPFVALRLFRTNEETFGSFFEFRKLRADLS